MIMGNSRTFLVIVKGKFSSSWPREKCSLLVMSSGVRIFPDFDKTDLTKKGCCIQGCLCWMFLKSLIITLHVLLLTFFLFFFFQIIIITNSNMPHTSFFKIKTTILYFIFHNLIYAQLMIFCLMKNVIVFLIKYVISLFFKKYNLVLIT